ncbi:hypothetical protein CAOG_08628 [Capsaspora owczarzaki ATCC 30864]|uniref:Phosphoglycerate mutase n=1 Tax=Capsaspora owczarzaki (strain ATCC 30864) TaxID=595528 RepID=A0A0D2VMY5_CAPO3|nr:hypothetical protein CAOG_08628 [Capsaspora owczarzaki ATCC 30864]KJE91562.1 hypothetical protein CAOG_008628 [Capsaspora owczarzaki ATCC 30864]|eukprot:XP_011270228.1 hypothetical protein CAOG_08628 [Capsaspora owczarzaki ATCC 30864]
MPRVVLITLVRHGQTEANKSSIIQGQTDIPLNDHGRRQAEHAAQSLAATKVDAMYTSDLSRAHETASIIHRRLKQPCELIVDRRLRERSCGVFEGKPWGSARKHAEALGIPHYEFRPEGGENSADVRARVATMLHDIVQNQAKVVHESLTHETASLHHVVVVSHGGLISDLLHYCRDHALLDLNGHTVTIPLNTSLTTLVVQVPETADSSTRDFQELDGAAIVQHHNHDHHQQQHPHALPVHHHTHHEHRHWSVKIHRFNDVEHLRELEQIVAPHNISDSI